MRDRPCQALLKWALPQLRQRWPGFRKVHGQVCKRLRRRIRHLGLAGFEAYRDYLARHSEEWSALDGLTRITISRFYRDEAVFDFIARDGLPSLARQALEAGRGELKVWSAGAGSGEEPYTLTLIWHECLQARFPAMGLSVVATDVDPHLCHRAQHACYPYGSLKQLPEGWRESAFEYREGEYCLKALYRRNVTYILSDIRERAPAGPFDMVLCRNLAFTYFDIDLQREVVARVKPTLRMGGALVIGTGERLPPGTDGLGPWSDPLRVYRRAGASPSSDGRGHHCGRPTRKV